MPPLALAGAAQASSADFVAAEHGVAVRGAATSAIKGERAAAALPRLLAAAVAFAPAEAARAAVVASASADASEGVSAAGATLPAGVAAQAPADTVAVFSGDPLRCEGCRFGWQHVCAWADAITFVRRDGTVVPADIAGTTVSDDASDAAAGATAESAASRLKLLVCSAFAAHCEALAAGGGEGGASLPTCMRDLPFPDSAPAAVARVTRAKREHIKTAASPLAGEAGVSLEV
jgi:hypothetical protein